MSTRYDLHAAQWRVEPGRVVDQDGNLVATADDLVYALATVPDLVRAIDAALHFFAHDLPRRIDYGATELHLQSQLAAALAKAHRTGTQS